jgi:uncharacterized iron-regulated protein
MIFCTRKICPPVVIAWVTGALLFGCVRTHGEWTSRFLSLRDPIGPEEIYRLPEGEKISFVQLSEDLRAARVVFLGEVHDQLEHHLIQRSILQEMVNRGKAVAVGMEMFERSQQPVLDHWSQGLLTEDEFLKAVDWDKSWAMNYALYKPILDEARKHGLKVLGLNLPRDLIRKVAGNGIDGLTDEDKKDLPDMDLQDQEHRAYIGSIYREHQGGTAKGFERFYQAQCLWDEGMSETLSRFLRSPEGEGKTVVVLAGNGHVVFNFGMPKRFYRRTPLPFKTIVLKPWRKELDEDFTFSRPSRPMADFLWVTPPGPPEEKRPRLGVVLKEKDEAPGLRIDRVIAASPAEKAGLRPGDRLVAVDGIEIQEIKQIHDALSRKGWGKDVVLILLRNGDRKEITVTLSPPDE